MFIFTGKHVDIMQSLEFQLRNGLIPLYCLQSEITKFNLDGAVHKFSSCFEFFLFENGFYT